MDGSRFILLSNDDDAFPVAFWGMVVALVMMMAIIAAS
jgi:hypothetical protein